jgi:hypothetical protein
MPDAVQKMRMCLAEVGADEKAIIYPNAEQTKREVDFVYDPDLVDFKIIWQASQLIETNEDDYVCWECISPHKGKMIQDIWSRVASRCLAWRPSTRDCGIDRVNS